METSKRIDLTPNKQGYTLERLPTKKQNVWKTQLNYHTQMTLTVAKLAKALFSRNQRVNHLKS